MHLNLTILECKLNLLAYAVTKAPNLNLTILECKYARFTSLKEMPFSFEFNHIGM